MVSVRDLELSVDVSSQKEAEGPGLSQTGDQCVLPGRCGMH